METVYSRKERYIDLPQAIEQSLKQLTVDEVLNRIKATDKTPHIVERNCMHLNGNWSNMLLKIQSTCKKTDNIGPLTARQTLACLPLPEQPAQQATSDVVHNSTTQSRVGICGGLTKLITAREGHGIRNSQNECNN